MREIRVNGRKITYDTIDKALSKRYNIFTVENTRWIGIYDTRKDKTAIARCHPDDIFDFKVGVMIAWCKLKNLKMPKFTVFTVYEQLCDMKPNTLFKIKIGNMEEVRYFLGNDQNGNYITQRKDDKCSSHFITMPFSNPTFYEIIKEGEGD